MRVHRVAAILAATGMLVALVGGFTAPAQARPVAGAATAIACDAAGLDPVSAGHLDLSTAPSGDEVDLRLTDRDTGIPLGDSVLLRPGPGALAAVPDGGSHGFLGGPGSPFWRLAAGPDGSGLELGLGTVAPEAEGVTWTIESATGPGEVFAYDEQDGVTRPLLGTGAGWERTVSLPPGGSAGVTWAFTAPGRYDVVLAAEVGSPDGLVGAGSTTLRFALGPCDDGVPAPLTDLDGSALTSANAFGVTQPGPTAAGASLTVTLPGRFAGLWAAPVLYPSEVSGRWTRVDETGQVSLVVPDVPPASYRLAWHGSDGTVLGWTPLIVTAPEPAPEPQEDAAPPADQATGPTAPDPVVSPAPRPMLESRPDRATPAPSRPVVVSIPGARTAGAAPPTSDRPVAACRSDGTSNGVADRGPEAGAPGGSGAAGGSGSGGSGSTTDPAGPAGPGSGPTPGQTTATSGHFDFGPVIEGDALVARIKDDRNQPPSWVEPSSLAFVLGAEAEATVPSNSDYAFLGTPGSTVWLVPQTQNLSVPWLGWNTQHESVRDQVSGPVRFTLDHVDGPGQLAVYLNDSFGGVGERKFGTAAGFPHAFDVPLNVHAHGNWAFTKPGVYRVTMTQSAFLKSGKHVSDSAVLTFRVGSSGERLAPPSRSSDRTISLRPAVTQVRATQVPIARCGLGPTGAPPVAGKVSLALMLILGGAVTVWLSLALGHRRPVASP